ncbi:hypothetical protein SDC9_194362 [bioreactor metagenome]|uniref:Uncharacterized protein n=1 Tax=bioreactor metagenome TaxID=1076179 RepID=A0A645IEP3_9ZZZZ
MAEAQCFFQPVLHVVELGDDAVAAGFLQVPVRIAVIAQLVPLIQGAPPAVPVLFKQVDADGVKRQLAAVLRRDIQKLGQQFGLIPVVDGDSDPLFLPAPVGILGDILFPLLREYTRYHQAKQQADRKQSTQEPFPPLKLFSV